MMQKSGFGSGYESETNTSAAVGAEAMVAQKLDTAASKAHQTIDRVHRKATEVSERVTTDGERMLDQACTWVAANPMKAVASALLAGYLFGRMRS